MNSKSRIKRQELYFIIMVNTSRRIPQKAREVLHKEREILLKAIEKNYQKIE